MAGSTFGNNFTVTTWGESHGPALGAVIDGCPAGLPLSEDDIQPFLDRRKPGTSAVTTARVENDAVRILSGVFEGKTTGTPISLIIENTSQHSKDYGNIAVSYRPGHADYTYDKKYGFRDYRGGGRSSGRETAGRVAAGAIAIKILNQLGITVNAYTRSIGDIEINDDAMDLAYARSSAVCMPDPKAEKLALEYIAGCRAEKDSVGGCIECRIENAPAGIGEPVFDKLDAALGKALFSIGAVKAVEIGAGIKASQMRGSENNDALSMQDGKVTFKSNHAGGILGGISSGEPIIIRAYVKPTPSIYQPQDTITQDHQNTVLTIAGRHDPVIVPRAVVVVEAMCALTLFDLMLSNMGSKMDYLTRIYRA